MIRVVPICLLVLLFAAPAEAQIRQKTWGVQFSAAPRWEVPKWQDVLLDADEADASGTEFTIGVARGMTLTGDWGISFVHRTIKDGSFIVREDETATISDGRLLAVELGGFFPFRTYNERVQIGIVWGFGAGSIRGSVVRTTDGGLEEVADTNSFLGVAGKSFVLTSRAEVGAAFILSPSVKLRVSGGINFPGMQAVSVGLLYLFDPR